MTRLYLPLLTHEQPAIRQQAAVILLTTYGNHALTYLRRLTEDPSLATRQEARLALLTLADLNGDSIKIANYHNLYIECLGRTCVYIGNYTMRAQDWMQADAGRAGWQKVLAVLAYLVHCGRRGTSRATLGAAVWGNTPSASSVSRTLTALQQALGRYTAEIGNLDQVLLITNDYCVLDPQYYQCDAQIFARTYELAMHCENEQGLEYAAPLYTQALKLYSGTYMADIPRGSEWFLQRREHLMNSFILASERLAEYYYTNGQYRRCIDVCLPILELDDPADDVIVWLLRAYAQEKRIPELRQTYRRYLQSTVFDQEEAVNQQDMVVQEYQRLLRSAN